MIIFLLSIVQDFTAIQRKMLSIKHCSLHPIQLTLTALLCVLYFAPAFAEYDKSYREEPIFPIPQKIEVNKDKAGLGKKLFFEPRLSNNNTVSCASCHQLDAGGDDNVAIGIMISKQQHSINTPSIFNAQYNFRQNWDGSAKSLHEQIDLQMKNQGEFANTWQAVVEKLTNDTNLKNEFSDNYTDGVTKNNIIDALVEFEKTLITPNSRFDRFLRNEADTLTNDELEGYKIFKELGCISCHQGINIGGNLYQKFGVFYNYLAERGGISKPDYGRMNISQRPLDRHVFKVPSLRNIAVTAPYFHDGSVKTIEDAIDIMGRTQLGRTLTINEIFLIKAFLYTLTGEYKNKPLDTES